MAQILLRFGGRWVPIGGGVGGGGGDFEEILDEWEKIADSIRKSIRDEVDRLENDLGELEDYLDIAFRDGIISEVEAKKIESYLASLELSKANVFQRYHDIIDNPWLSSARRQAMVLVYRAFDQAYSTFRDEAIRLVNQGTVSKEEAQNVNELLQSYRNTIELLTGMVGLAADDISEAMADHAREQAESVAGDLFDGVDQRVTTTETQIINMNGLISSKISEEEVTKRFNDANSAQKQYTDNQVKDLKEDLTDLDRGVTDLKDYLDNAFLDGIIYDSEKNKVESYIKQLEGEKQQFDGRVALIVENPYLEGATRDNVVTARELYEEAYDHLIDTIMDVINTEGGRIDQGQINEVNYAFDRYNDSISLLAVTLEIAIDFISKAMAEDAKEAAKDYADELKGDLDDDVKDLNGRIGDTQKYIDNAFRDGVISEAEAKKIEAYLNSLDESQSNITGRYDEIYNNSYMTPQRQAILYQNKKDYDESYAYLVNAIYDAIEDSKTTTEEASKVNAAFRDYNRTVQRMIKALEQSIDFIAKRKADEAFYDAIDDAEEKYEGRVSTVESEIIQMADLISQTVRREDYLTDKEIVDDRVKEAEENAKAAQELADAARDRANTAEELARNAEQSAKDATKLLEELADDGILAPSEKKDLRREWQAIKTEYPTIIRQAVEFGIDVNGRVNVFDNESNATYYSTGFNVQRQVPVDGSIHEYSSAYSTLETYLTPMFENMEIPSPIVLEELLSIFTNYYDQRQLLLKTISDLTKRRAQEAQDSADDARDVADEIKDTIVPELETRISTAESELIQTAEEIALRVRLETYNVDRETIDKNIKAASDRADAAQTVASNAKADAERAQGVLNDISADNKLTPGEKIELVREVLAIDQERPKYDAQAQNYGITTERTAYNTAHRNLKSYTDVVLQDLSTTTTVNGSELRSKFSDYYDKRATLLQRITEGAKKRADDAQKTADDLKNNVIPGLTERVREAELKVLPDSIIGTVTDSKQFKDVNALAGTAKSAADKAQNDANAAQTTANNARTDASNAQTSANNARTAADNAASSAKTANDNISNLASDSKLTPSEKKELKREWDQIVSERPKNISAANTYGVSTTNYQTRYNTLNTYLQPLLSNLNTTSDIVGNTLRSNFVAYTDARTDLLNAISARAKELADAAKGAADSAQNAADKAQRDFDNYTPGGRNYAIGTAKPNVRTSFNGNNNHTSRLYDLSTDVAGQEVTLSGDIRLQSINQNSGGTTRYVLQLIIQTSSTTYYQVVTLTNMSNGTYSFNQTINIPSDARSVQLGDRADFINSGTVTLSKFMASKGKKVHDWQPAPEDADYGLIYARGTGYNRNANRIIRINGVEHFNAGGGRGLRLDVVNRQTMSVIETNTYDTMSVDANRTAMATKLNSLASDVIVIVTSFDAFNTNPALRTALERCGGSGTEFTGSEQHRTPFALIGIPGIMKNSGIEMATQPTSSAPYAEVSTRVVDGVPQGMNTNIYSLASRVDSAEQKITPDQILNTVTSTTTWKNVSETANKGVNDAAAAHGAARNADTKAGNAATAASNAHGAANAADTKAGNAQNSANAARGEADKANKGLGELTQTMQGEFRVTAEQIQGRVSKQDYNGNTLVSLINQTASTVSILAKYIDFTIGENDGSIRILGPGGENDVITELSAEMRGFDTLFVGKLTSPSLMNFNNDNYTIYVHPNNGDDSNDGSGWGVGQAFETLQAAIDSIPKYNNGSVEIQVFIDGGSGITLNENIWIDGFVGSGSIFVNCRHRANRLNGWVVIRGNTNFIRFYDITINCKNAARAVYVDRSIFVIVDQIDIFGNNSTDDGVYITSGSYANVRGCRIRDVKTCIHAIHSQAMCEGTVGYGTEYGLQSRWNATTGVTGSAPGGRIATENTNTGGRFTYGNQGRTGSANTEGIQSVVDTWGLGGSGSGGGNTPPPSPPSTDSWTANSARSWRNMYGGWRTDNDRVYQSQWGGHGHNRGLWFFGQSVRNAVNGKRITRIRVWMSRRSEGGHSAATGAVIRAHEYASQPSGTPNYLSPTHTVNFRWGESKWVTLPSSFHSIFQNGNARGIGIYTTSSSTREYMIFNNNARIEITYQ